jgi:hypothetical protein
MRPSHDHLDDHKQYGYVKAGMGSWFYNRLVNFAIVALFGPHHYKKQPAS